MLATWFSNNALFITALVSGISYGMLVGLAKAYRKRFEREQRELLRWQMELERKSSNIRNSH